MKVKKIKDIRFIKTEKGKGMPDWSRAAMTVEASVLVPCTVLVTAALLILIFFVHNQTYYRCAAFETAMVANARHAPIRSEEQLAQEAAETRITERITDQSMPGSEPEYAASITQGKTEIQFWGQRFPMFAEELFDYHVSETVASVRPVKWIRHARVLRSVLEGSER